MRFEFYSSKVCRSGGIIWEYRMVVKFIVKALEFREVVMAVKSLYVKIADDRLYFIFPFHFILFFFSFFFFYFQNNLGQGLSVTLSHQSQLDGVVTRLITGYKRRKQKVLEQSDVIQHGPHMLASCYTHGCLGQGAQQLARAMGNSI